jgi:hypothetical protein
VLRRDRVQGDVVPLVEIRTVVFRTFEIGPHVVVGV